MSSTDKLTIVKAILMKTVAKGATAGEEAMAVDKAVKLMGLYAIPHSAVASVWPRGWGFNGKRLEATAPKQAAGRRPMDDYEFVDLINRHFRETKETRKATQSEKDAVNERVRRTGTAKGSTAPGSIGNFARQLLKSNIRGIGPYSYGHILGRILDRYPHSKTTVASLRWYENEMRKQGIDIPKGRPMKG